LGGNYSHALAINNRGHIIGEGNNAQGQTHAILWSVPSLTPEEQVRGLIESVKSVIKSGKLKKAVGKALICELHVILKKIEKGKGKKACRLLHAFSRQVEHLAKKGWLPVQIEESLINQANDVGVCRPLP
jgi:probable HAF family extracellular repeat protein